MGNSPIRRGQLITPFGVGALYVSKDGEGIITAGLDHWYKKSGGQDTEYIEEFKFFEWRLEKQLAVNHFRLPPDHRNPYNNFRSDSNDPNLLLTIPFLRFPKWHFCSYCRKLRKVSLAKREQVICNECTDNIKKKSPSRKYYYNVEMIQVPIVAVCEHGHIQDFPWNEWAHRTANPTCDDGNLKLISKGTPGLLGMTVKCYNCDAPERSLASVLNGKVEGGPYRTDLSRNLDGSGVDFLCQGLNTWNGDTEGSICNNHLLGSLRASSNVYFSKIESSIFVPIENNDDISNIIELFGKSKPTTIINMYIDMGDKIPVNAFRTGDLKKMFIGFTDQDIEKALDKYLDINSDKQDDDQEQDAVEFRRPEYNLFNKENNFDKIITILPKIEEYNKIITQYFDKITLVKKLTETKALYGFTRLNTQSDLSRRQLKEYLWREQPNFKDSWLPAIQVSGEGIFFNFKEELVREFENNTDVINRVEKFRHTPRSRPLDEQKASPRFMMLHTFAHIMINTFIFECGYGAASLQERIYCSNDPDKPMAGVLIYTAAGDSEGTMGGLVRMGKAGFLERVVEKSIESSMWCSVDPVCMEISESGGQGPESLNLAACHNCGLLPETSCEAFNSYLDRGFLTGSIENKNIGFFSE